MSAAIKHEYAIYHPHTRSETYVSATNLADAKNAGADILGVPRWEVEGRALLAASIDGDVAEMRRVPVVSIGQGDFVRDYSEEELAERKLQDAGSAAVVCYVMAACVFAAGVVLGIVLAVWGGAR